MTPTTALQALPDFNDARVQAVYSMLCNDQAPPDQSEHWGWMARNIVAALAAQAAPADAQTTCNCRWRGDEQVQQCTLHEAHVDAIHDWAERAKTAEDAAATARKFTNELGNAICITIEGPTSVSENVLTPMEVRELTDALNAHAAADTARKMLAYCQSLKGQQWGGVDESVDRQNLAVALDNLEQTASMLLSMAHRDAA